VSYQPIENYGIIGNMRTVALVSMNDSIERSAACRSLYRSEFILLQFISWGRDSCSGLGLPAEQFGRWFSLVSMVSINLGIWFYGVEMGDAGETIEPEES